MPHLHLPIQSGSNKILKKMNRKYTYGQYLDVNTTVAEMVIQSDTFRSRVQGVVYGAKLVSITPVGDDTYETTLSLSNDIVNDLRKLYLAAMSDPDVSGMGV